MKPESGVVDYLLRHVTPLTRRNVVYLMGWSRAQTSSLLLRLRLRKPRTIPNRRHGWQSSERSSCSPMLDGRRGVGAPIKNGIESSARKPVARKNSDLF